MADDPDVPSLVDFDPDCGPTIPGLSSSQEHFTPPRGGRHVVKPKQAQGSYQTMNYDGPSFGGAPGSGFANPNFGTPDFSSMPGAPSMQQVQAMVNNMSPDQMQKLMSSFQQLASSGVLPPQMLNPAMLSQLGIPQGGGSGGGGGHGHSHGGGDQGHGHSHGGQPCHGHGNPQQQQQQLPFSFPSSGDQRAIASHKPHIEELDEDDPEYIVVDPLILATQRGDIVTVRKLIEEKEVNVNNIRDGEGNTALHWAAFSPNTKVHFQIMQFLVESAGADVDSENEVEHQTPLDWACIAGNARAVSYLIKHNADFKHTDKRGYNCLHHATQYNEALIAYFLIKQGLSTDSQDLQGHTCLHWASYMGHEHLVTLFTYLGANVNKQDDQGYTPLHWAAVKGNKPAVRALLAEGAEPKVLDKEGNSASFAADKKGNFELATILNTEAPFYRRYRTAWGRRSQKVVWFFAGGLTFLIFAMLMCVYPVWMALCTFALVMYGGSLLLGSRWPSDIRPNTFWFGMYIAGYSLSTWTYFTRMVDWHVYFYPTESLVFYGMNVLAVFLFSWCKLKDPGVIRPNSTNNMDWLVSKMEKGEPVPEICTTCMMAKPLRSKHCKTCNRCVARFDHHCYWMDNCIGVYTHKYFVMLILLFFCGHFLFFTMAMRYILALNSTPVDSMWPIFSNLPTMYHAQPLVFFMGFAHLTQMLWEFFTIYRTYQGISMNMTYNEMQNGERYSYFRAPSGNFYNPFQRQSFIENFKDWWSPKINYFSLYFITREALMV